MRLASPIRLVFDREAQPRDSREDRIGKPEAYRTEDGGAVAVAAAFCLVTQVSNPPLLSLPNPYLSLLFPASSAKTSVRYLPAC